MSELSHNGDRAADQENETLRPAPRRDGAPQRAADPRADLTGPRRRATRTARSRSPPGRKPALAPELAVRVPLLRGPLRLAEAFVLIPMVRMKLRAGAAAVRGRPGDRGDAGRLDREPGAPPPALERREGADAGGARAGARRWWRSATATWPPTTGSSTRRSAPTRPGSDDPASATKEHERCGSNLVAPMLVLSAGGPAPARAHARASPGRSRGRRSGSRARRSRPRCSPGASAIPRPPRPAAFHRPGHEIQRLIATKEPTPEQLEVGVAALREILRVEQEAEGERQPSDPLPAT